MAINGYIGRPGSGKSYALTREVLRQADRGHLCFTNWSVAHPNVYRYTEDQLLDLPPGKIFIDEAHLWFPARGALALPPSWLAMLSQTRKSGWDLYWCTQHERRIDSVIKDVTTWMYLCSSWFRIQSATGPRPLFFMTEQYEPEYFRRKGHREAREIFLFDQRVATAYDTMERLQVASHTEKSTDRYAAQSKTYAEKLGSAAAARRRPPIQPQKLPSNLDLSAFKDLGGSS